MNLRPNVIKIGNVLKTHGNKGKLKVKIEENLKIPDKYKGTVFFSIHKKMVPFFIDDWETLSNELLLIKLEELNSISEAENYLDTAIFIDKSLIAEEDLIMTEEINGFILIDQDDNEIGRITNLINQNQNILLELENDLLVPFHSNLLLDYNLNKKFLKLELPEGLLSIN
jgi:16S rRNA processing protein RimM